MVFAHDFTHDTGRFFGGAVGAQPHIVHTVQDTAVNGFQAVAGIRQGTRYDDGHSVIEIRLLHLLVDINGMNQTKFHVFFQIVC
jgi:hypothetical protein